MERKKLNNINTNIFCALKVAEKSKVPVLFISNPGVGKTTSVYYFAKVRGYETVLLRGNSTTAEEVMGYDVAPRDVTYDHKMAAINLRPSWFEEVLRNHAAGKKTLLFLDEITTANEFVQSALLHLIFERKVHTESIPEDTLIVSAGNYAQNLSNTMGLLPPVMNRFMIFNIIPDETELETFLNKYDGSIVSSEGKRNDYSLELEKMMEKLDKQELNIDEGKLNKVGEYIEKVIRETTRRLITKDKTIDLAVTDLQNIYSDVSDGDPRLYGFVSFRTLNYLRDVTIAFYQCFGKDGICSDNFKNSIIGLCGCGVTRDKGRNGDVKLNKNIANDYFEEIKKIISDVERLNNNKYLEYEKFIATYATAEAKTLTNADLAGLINKLNEMNADPELVNIERPIDKDSILKLMNSIEATANSMKLTERIAATAGEAPVIPYSAEKITGYIITWNSIAKLTGIICGLISDPKRGYDSSIQSQVNSKIGGNLKYLNTKLRTIRKILVDNDPTNNIIPNAESITK